MTRFPRLPFRLTAIRLFWALWGITVAVKVVVLAIGDEALLDWWGWSSIWATVTMIQGACLGWDLRGSHDRRLQLRRELDEIRAEARDDAR